VRHETLNLTSFSTFFDKLEVNMRLLSRWLRVTPLGKRLKCPAPAIPLLLAAVLLPASSSHPVFAWPAGESHDTSSYSQGKPDVRRPFPQLSLDGGRTVEYMGMFPADTKYQPSSKLTRFADKNGVLPSFETQQEEVPRYTLRSSEYAVENYAPPRHAKSSAHAESPFRGLFNDLVTLAYGYQKVLQSPQNVATDSEGRVIVTDSGIPAVHVIDPQRRSSFRILGGHGRRLVSPGDVAVDGSDKIYIADYPQDRILVYDRYGRFLSSIGRVHDENLFQQLSGFAIDRRSGRLYAADGPRHMIYILDLQGAVLKRVGQAAEDATLGQLKMRGNIGPHEFNYPTHIVVGEREVFVLDSGGTRIQILDLDCNLLGSLIVQHAAQDHATALGLDTEGRVYVLYSGTSEIRVYNREGKVLTSFGETGVRAGEFYAPGGLWVDATNRLYVSDTSNRRIQVFQLRSEARRAPAEAGLQASSH